MNFNTPPVVKNLLIINLIVFIMQTITPIGEDMTTWFGLCSWHGTNFMPYQFITSIFLHGSITHLFSNMFALWMFGRLLEYDLGSRRFLMFYLITGVGAGVFDVLISEFQYQSLMTSVEAFMANPTPTGFGDIMPSRNIINESMDAWRVNPSSYGYIAGAIEGVNSYVDAFANRVTIGASGAVFGVLLAFGLMHPNDRIQLLIPPIPIKAKYFVMGYGAIELYLGMTGAHTGVAHFAHLGGMIWGFILLWTWKKRGEIYY